MDVAVQLAVQVVVALVLQRGAARRALEALHVQILILDAHEHAATHTTLYSSQSITCYIFVQKNNERMFCKHRNIG